MMPAPSTIAGASGREYVVKDVVDRGPKAPSALSWKACASCAPSFVASAA